MEDEKLQEIKSEVWRLTALQLMPPDDDGCTQVEINHLKTRLIGEIQPELRRLNLNPELFRQALIDSFGIGWFPDLNLMQMWFLLSALKKLDVSALQQVANS